MNNRRKPIIALGAGSLSVPLAAMLAAATLVGALFPVSTLAQEIKIGGTGGALATMQMLADGYRKTDPEAKVLVLPSLGSSGGIKALLAGAIQIAVSSRPLTPSEASQGANAYELGRTPFVFAVALKTKIDGITTKDLVAIYSGAKKQWPDGTAIRLVLRPVSDADSQMVGSISPEVRHAKNLADERLGMLFATTDQDAADNIEKIPGAFGTTTLAQIVIERRDIKPLRLNGVEPSGKTIADGSYLYSRRFFIVIGPKTPASAQQFVTFARSAVGREILSRTGYVLP